MSRAKNTLPRRMTSAKATRTHDTTTARATASAFRDTPQYAPIEVVRRGTIATAIVASSAAIEIQPQTAITGFR